VNEDPRLTTARIPVGRSEPSAQNTVRTALVIGGGIAGPVAAMALDKAGIEARVYEARSGRADGIGGMLGLAPNGIAALDLLDIGDAVRGIGLPVPAMVMQSWTGKTLATLGGGPGPVFHAVWRAKLYRVLYDEAARRGIGIEHGKRLVRADQDDTGVTAYFADGTRATADILIGADGIRSTVRQLIDPAAPPPGYTGLLGFGGWSNARIPSTGGAFHMAFGKRAFFSWCVDDSGQVGWFINVPSKQPMTMAEARAVGATEWLRRFRELVADDRVPALEVLAGVDPDELVIVGGLDIMDPQPRWYAGRMVLVGDSAHVPSNSSGQGASMAIEGAVELARCLRDLPPAEAFGTYEALRRPRVARVVAGARRTNANKAAGPVARVIRDLTMPTMMKLLAKPEKMAWLSDYRIDWAEPAKVSA